MVTGRSLFSGVSSFERSMFMNMIWSGRYGFQISSSRSIVIDVFSAYGSLVMVKRLILLHILLEGLLLLNEQLVIKIYDIRCHSQALIVILLVFEELIDVLPRINGVFEAILEQLVLLPGVVQFSVFKVKIVLAAFLISPGVSNGVVEHGIKVFIFFSLYLSFERVLKVIFVVVSPIAILSIRKQFVLQVFKSFLIDFVVIEVASIIRRFNPL